MHEFWEGAGDKKCRQDTTEVEGKVWVGVVGVNTIKTERKKVRGECMEERDERSRQECYSARSKKARQALLKPASCPPHHVPSLQQTSHVLFTSVCLILPVCLFPFQKCPVLPACLSSIFLSCLHRESIEGFGEVGGRYIYRDIDETHEEAVKEYTERER